MIDDKTELALDMSATDAELLSILNREIARELLLEELKVGPSEKLLDDVLAISKNPFDAVVVYKMLDLMRS